MGKQEFLQYLENQSLEYSLHEHEPAFTVEQSCYLHKIIPGSHSKNLFLKDRKESYFLVSILHHKRLDLKAFSKMYGKGSVSFANEQTLFDILRLQPGSVTPYGLYHDTARSVNFFLDEDFLKAHLVNFHPLQNDSTVSVDVQLFLQFFTSINHPVEVIKIPELK